MSTIISVNATRAGTPVSTTPIDNVQLDLMTQQEAHAYGGAQSGEGPYFRYAGYMPSLITLMQGDLLTDTQNVDPKTGTNRRYRIIGDPEPFGDGHTEIVVDRVIGT